MTAKNYDGYQNMPESKLKTANTEQINDAAKSAATRDTTRGVCDPHGSWSGWINIEGLWNSFNHETSMICSRERPIAYQVFVKAYLTAQGWKR